MGDWVEDHKKELLGAVAVGGGLAALNPGMLAGLFGTEAAVAGGAGAAGGLLGAEGAGGALGGGLIAEDLAGVVGSEAAKGGLLGNAAFAASGAAGKGLAGKLGKATLMSGLSGPQQGPPPMQPFPQGAPLPAGNMGAPISATHPIDVIDPEKRRRLARLMAMQQGRPYA